MITRHIQHGIMLDDKQMYPTWNYVTW